MMNDYPMSDFSTYVTYVIGNLGISFPEQLLGGVSILENQDPDLPTVSHHHSSLIL